MSAKQTKQIKIQQDHTESVMRLNRHFEGNLPGLPTTQPCTHLQQEGLPTPRRPASVAQVAGDFLAPVPGQGGICSCFFIYSI